MRGKLYTARHHYKRPRGLFCSTVLYERRWSLTRYLIDFANLLCELVFCTYSLRRLLSGRLSIANCNYPIEKNLRSDVAPRIGTQQIS
jgi:hypothetical protein